MQNKLKFGTDGIRGNADQYPFTENALKKLGKAIAKWSTFKYKKNNPKVLIGHDTRISCDRIKQALISGLKQYSLNIIDAQVSPTPAICQLIQKTDLGFDFGIVISASHNPYKDNGIKIFDKQDTKLNKTDEELIVDFFEETNIEKTLETNSVKLWQDANSKYKKNILNFFEPNFMQNLKIVLDCANGATYKIAPEIFEELGAQVITIANSPDGKNINKNCGALHPENLKKIVLKNNADIGFAFDGDGDRLIAVNQDGEILDGDDILALLLTHPKFKDIKKLVGTIMTNHGLELFLEKNDKQLIRTSVGDKYIAAKLASENLLLGGETSGHIIMKDYINSGDGIFNALRIVQTAIITNNWKLKNFTKTPQIMLNLTVKHKRDLSIDPYKKIIAKHKKLLNLGRVVVRYSGTENLLRVMVEDIKETTAKDIAKKLAQELKLSLN